MFFSQIQNVAVLQQYEISLSKLNIYIIVTADINQLNKFLVSQISSTASDLNMTYNLNIKDIKN